MTSFSSNAKIITTIAASWLVFNGWAFYPPAGEWLNLALAAFLLAAFATRIYNKFHPAQKTQFQHPIRRRIYGNLDIQKPRQ
jgi:hypothetical protein